MSRMGAAAILTVLFTLSALSAAEQTRPGSDWLARAQAEIERSEYHFAADDDGGVSAPNRAHDMRTRVTPRGIEVRSRTQDAFTLSLSASAWGRGNELMPLAEGALASESAEVSLDRGPLVERYVNDSRGLEQLFDVPVPPPGPRATGPLVIEQQLDGDVLAQLADDGSAVLFSDPTGKPVARLAELVVLDSLGTPVPARFRFEARALRLEIHDADAVYPLHVDPLLTSPAWTDEINQAGAFFGLRVAPAGDVNADGFSDVLIGAYNYDAGQADEGRVYLYLGAAGGPSTTEARTFESNQADAMFGWAISTAGDLDNDGFDDFAIGARDYDEGQTDEGLVFLYAGSSNVNNILLIRTIARNQATAGFGWSLAYGGDVDGDGDAELVVGAPRWDDGQTDEGAVFVFFGDPVTFVLDTPFSATSNEAEAFLGISVAGGVDVNADGFSDVFAGASGWGPTPSIGRVLGFYGSGTGLAATPSWTEDGAGGGFGDSVAGVGDTNGDGYADLAIGASTFTDTHTSEGRVYLYRGSSTGLLSSPTSVRDGEQNGAQLGRSLGPAGDVNGDGFADLAVGANGFDPPGIANGGQVRVWHGSASGIATAPNWTYEGAQANSGTGEAVFTAGDVNGDGFADLLVGQGGYDNGQTDEGRALIFLGSGEGLSGTTQATINVADPSGDGSLGWVVANAGDVNADGFSDVIVGAPFHRLGGAAWVHLGSATGLNPVAAVEILGSVNDGQFGFAVAGIGDVNGDGYDDVAVGAPEHYFDAGRGFFAGRVFVYRGGPSGVDAIADFSRPTTQPSTILFDDRYGETICGAGDVNGDGFSDFMVGGATEDMFLGGSGNPQVGTGPVFFEFMDDCDGGDLNSDGYSDLVVASEGASLFLGGPTGLSSQSSWSVGPTGSNGGSPESVAVGDLNGDGHPDIAYGFDGFFTGTAVVDVYHGGPAGPDTTFELELSVEADLEAMDFAEDVNGDGFSDLVVGCSGAGAGGNALAGRVRVFLGSSAGLSSTAAFTRDGTVVGGRLGRGVAGADVNGDGFADVVIGESGRGDGFAYVHLGGGGDGLEYIPRNYRGDSTGPVAHLGSSGSGDRFRILSRGRTPRGRGLVAMDHQVAPLGTLLPAGTHVLGGYFDTGSTDSSGAGVNFNRLVSGLAAETPYKWRMRFRAKDPIFRTTRWISLAGSAREETDVRTSCLALTWFRDQDGDGFGTSGTTQSACTQPAGFVAVSGDCNDTSDAMFPGNPEICDGLDNNCNGPVDDGFAAPTGIPVLSASESAGALTLTWPAIAGADRYDTVRGKLDNLRPSGNYTDSIDQCLGNDTATSATDPSLLPAGVGLFYLVRAVNCTAPGSYNGGSHRQVGSRDAEIAASPNDCP